MRPVEAELKSLTSYGVMELEFAWTVTQIDEILTVWGNSMILKELGVTFLDFGFLIFYSAALAGVTIILTRRVFHEILNDWGYRIALVPFLAAGFDVIENINIIFILTSPSSYPSFTPLVVSVCATIKFGLLIVTIIFWVMGLVFTLLKRKS